MRKRFNNNCCNESWWFVWLSIRIQSSSAPRSLRFDWGKHFPFHVEETEIRTFPRPRLYSSSFFRNNSVQSALQLWRSRVDEFLKNPPYLNGLWTHSGYELHWTWHWNCFFICRSSTFRGSKSKTIIPHFLTFFQKNYSDNNNTGDWAAAANDIYNKYTSCPRVPIRIKGKSCWYDVHIRNLGDEMISLSIIFHFPFLRRTKAKKNSWLFVEAAPCWSLWLSVRPTKLLWSWWWLVRVTWHGDCRVISPVI